jgi:hypothetical protein
MAGIFISYRREDAGAYAGRLYDSLAAEFGPDRVFMDIQTLRPGVDFATALNEAIRTCDVMITLIGPRWLTVTDSEGRRRLDDPDDWVRQETATALARDDIRVVPVLVGGAVLPAAADLPEDLQLLRRRHSFEIGDERWDYDARLLVEGLAPLVKRRRSRVGWWPAVLILALLLVAGLVYLVSSGPTATTPTLTPSELRPVAGDPMFRDNNFSLAWAEPWTSINDPRFVLALSNGTSEVGFLSVDAGDLITCASNVTQIVPLPVGAISQIPSFTLDGSGYVVPYVYTETDGRSYFLQIMCQRLNSEANLVTYWYCPQLAPLDYSVELSLVNGLLGQIIPLSAS